MTWTDKHDVTHKVSHYIANESGDAWPVSPSLDQKYVILARGAWMCCGAWTPVAGRGQPLPAVNCMACLVKGEA